MTVFKDHFSTQTADYAQFRPGYPDALYQWIASHAPDQDLLWDCACGNGQASVGLARHFRQVLATDASAAQIAAAAPAAGLRYAVASAEQAPLATSSVSAITVAQALHWFDLPAFWAECMRLLKPNGLLAVWTYAPVLLSDGPASMQAFLAYAYHDKLGPYWPPERAHVNNGYADIALPWAELETPTWTLPAALTQAQLLGYIGSWSATAQYQKRGQGDAVAELAEPLAAAWGDTETLDFHWPLTLRATRKP